MNISDSSVFPLAWKSSSLHRLGLLPDSNEEGGWYGVCSYTQNPGASSETVYKPQIRDADSRQWLFKHLATVCL